MPGLLEPHDHGACVTRSPGTHLNARQIRQLCDGPRTVQVAFDADSNGSGQLAARRLSRSLLEQGLSAGRVSLPPIWRL